MRTVHHITMAITALVILAIMHPVYAQDNETDNQTAVPFEFSGTITTGYHAYSNSGYRGKVSEYSVPSSGADVSINLQGSSRKNYFYLSSEMLDQDDQTHQLNFDLSRFLQMDLSYMKFNHFLDHDPLTNQDTVTDIDAGKNNGITVEELEAGSSIRIPSFTFVKFLTNFRTYK